MDAALRTFVRQRAGDRCEYCRLPQEASLLATFHIEHIVPRQHQGATEPQNLALACHHCNSHKGPSLTGIDPVTRSLVRLFDPRSQSWKDHFEFAGAEIIGRTPTGRATVHVMAMNLIDRLELRSEVQGEGLELDL